MDLKIQFIEQKNILRDELDDLIDEHDDLLEEYGDLNNQLYQKDSLIQEQIAEIRNLIRTKNDLREAKLKIENLREFLRTILRILIPYSMLQKGLVLKKIVLLR